MKGVGDAPDQGVGPLKEEGFNQQVLLNLAMDLKVCIKIYFNKIYIFIRFVI